MINCKGLNIKLLLLLIVPFYDSLFVSGELRCTEKDRAALLMFKQGFIDEGDALSSWGSEEDNNECCQWIGITCGNATGRVIALELGCDVISTPLRGNISKALLELNHLTHLDLSCNDFGNSEIPEFIGSLEKLLHISFKSSYFSGIVPPQIGNLTNLTTLDLGYNQLVFNNLDWLSHLSSLSFLDLSSSSLRGTNLLQDILRLPSLIELSLMNCEIPSFFVVNSSSTSLSVLHLDGCGLTSMSFRWLFNVSTALRSIGLYHNHLNAIPEDFGRFTFLEHLNMTANELTGGIPKFLGNLSHLIELDLLGNNLSEPLPDLFNKLSVRAFSSLKILNLQRNQFKGPLPDSFGQFPRLETLDLSNNQITGSVPDLSELVSLKELDLSGNKLEKLPTSLGQLSNLEYLDVTSNYLKGTISDVHFLKLHNLKSFGMSYNSLVLNFPIDWVPPFQLHSLALSSCNMGPHFPTWLRTQNHIYWLDLSCAGISDEVPNWFWNWSPTMTHLNLSYNQISGEIPYFSSKLDTIDISFNNFSGHVPSFPPHSGTLQLSNNMFLGSISSVCTIFYDLLILLDLSNNQLSGEIPNCWENMTKLRVLNLANNELFGSIPQSLGSLQSLYTLHLSDNNLSAELPSTLKNLKDLLMIDVGGNELTGNIPSWIGTHLTALTVVILRRNNFNGSIPPEICYLNDIQILDLSRNSLSGRVPHCFNNFSSLVQQNRTTEMVIGGEVYYYGFPAEIVYFIDRALVQWKGQEREYLKSLGLLKLIDLSSNRLVGDIPREFSELRALISLNLSRNYLDGNILSNISEMELLECLDLSRNQFSGKIPIGLAELHYLAVLDLSNNNLSGKIPSSTQLQSFDPSSYAGNRELCGRPLTICPGDDPSSPTTDNEEDDDFIAQFLAHEFYISVILGFVVGFWGVVGTLVLKSTWRNAYFNLFNRFQDWLYVRTRIYAGRLSRSC